MKEKLVIAVIGGSKSTKKVEQIAQNLGRNIAKMGWILVCGGLSGVMEAVAKGAKQAKGLTIGIIPQDSKEFANPYIDIVIPTGLGYARNILVVKTADIVVALAGEYGTLSEIAHALQMGKPVFSLKSWSIPGVIKVKTVAETIEKIKLLLKR